LQKGTPDLIHAQITTQQILSVLKRRRKLILTPFIGIALCCAIGAFILPRKYESSTTILVQKDEILNPLVSFDMAVAIASEDMLKTFNEIVYSDATVQTLIDSLHLAAPGTLSPSDRQELSKKILKNITTERPGSTSFRIAYIDPSPVEAQHAVSLIANLFIRTILYVENQRNEMAVEFFENKLEELRRRYETSQAEMLAQLRRHIQEMPGDNHSLSARLAQSEQDIRDIGERLKTDQHALSLIRQYPSPMVSDAGRKALYDLEAANIPYAPDLRALLRKYEEYSQKYTPRYPEMQQLVQQINDLCAVIKTTLEGEVDKQRNMQVDAEQGRAEAVENLQRSTISQRAGEDTESSYDIYRQLYNEMKIKLEQARTTRDLGRTQRDRFIIIDPPLVPTEPSKPNRVLIIAGGFGLGLLTGLLTAAIAELLDTKMRDKEAFELYQKPIIAYVPDAANR